MQACAGAGAGAGRTRGQWLTIMELVLFGKVQTNLKPFSGIKLHGLLL